MGVTITERNRSSSRLVKTDYWLLITGGSLPEASAHLLLFFSGELLRGVGEGFWGESAGGLAQESELSGIAPAPEAIKQMQF